MTPRPHPIRRTLGRLAVGFAVFWLAACDTLPAVRSSGPRIDATQPVTVALLVPAGSGQTQDNYLATSLENAARLAMADLQGVTINLKVYKTGGQPNRAAALAVQAVNEGAKIILGPVFASEANAAGVAVAASNVNVLSFSNNTDIAGGNVFVLGQTFENTADRLVSYAVSQGKPKILIVNANDPAEQKGRTAIAGAIARNGATNIGQASFDLSQNALIAAAPGIARKAQSDAVDAIFMTSGTAGALPILSQLLVDNGATSANAQFIGLQRWDIPDAARDLPGLQGGWFALPSPTLNRQFESRYAQAYGQPPHPIAGLAYDGIAAVGALLKSGKPSALSTGALTQGNGFVGVNGIFRLRSDGSNQRGMAIATIRGRQVIVIDPAPKSFGGAGF